MKKNNKHQMKPKAEERPVEKYFNQLDSIYSQGNKAVYAFFLALTFFAVMGLIWMIPFPQFQFLVDKNMHTFLNWGSFFIAIVIYCYLKLAATLSYAALMSISVMSFFIVQLEYVEKDGGPSVVLVCGVLAFIGIVGLFFNSKKEQVVQIKDFVQLLTLGPIWLWSKVYDRFNIKY